MKTNEHLALFLLGVGTLGITFLLLLAFSDKNAASISAIDNQVQVSSAQATLVPQAPRPESPSMEALDREVADTFAKTAEYLGRGRFEEKEHIALLERLEFYSGLNSIRPALKEHAQELIADMSRLLTLKESVARRVQLAGQISAAERDVQVHLARGERDEAEAQRLITRLEGLYAIHGLSDTQNRQLRTSLAALKKAYSTDPAPSSSRQAKAPEIPTTAAKNIAQKPVTPDTLAKAASETAPKVSAQVPAPEEAVKPVQKASAPAPIPTEAKQPVETVSAQAPAPEKPAEPAPKVAATAPAPKTKQTAAERLRENAETEYSRVMTFVSRYFVVKKYDPRKHEELTSDLKEVAKSSNYLTKDHRERLNEAIEKMQRVEEMMEREEGKRTRASAR